MFIKFLLPVPALFSRTKAASPPDKQGAGLMVRDASDIVTLSLISHTNAGKTTLARTLLRQDVGEVRDAPHVTLFNESHTLLETGGFMLRLWDTPGFGDSARLMKRLKRESSPVLWFLSQTWDRITDRPLWCSQQALKNVRDEADVVLYLVNAAEPPEAASYIGPEMEILGWVEKPVVVLLNQTGIAGSSELEAAELESWRAHLKQFESVREVLTLDAFARCWVQEDLLMKSLAPLMLGSKIPTFMQIQRAWAQRNVNVFQTSVRLISEQLTAALFDGVDVRSETLLERVGWQRDELNREYNDARQKLATQLADRIEQTTNSLIEVHGLKGQAGHELNQVAKEHFHLPQAVSENIWGVLGSFAGGAMGGLIADLKLGGMTFGGGALLGGLASGIGAYALIRSYNLVRGSDHRLRWSREHFREQVKLAFLTYLAVCHFGRGRGEWKESEQPQHWREVVDEVTELHADALDHLWKAGVQKDTQPAVLSRQANQLTGDCMAALLERLYPDVDASSWRA
ncbi:MAG: GTPase domain-containing protein [Prosthecobacter sp.]|nr:GTPase domain-containing protein [Prosthecobacter sp.]